ncbi:hypothetical protein [Nostoc sp. FACHB-892]|uniref:hypothetical protein n=1 Tax=Nostoc sp. FACHB-892 TaxID=2692843 RepID=UPI001683683B|nr:hypothetical protein [Nostoc sp. FACHB-892]
MTSIFIKLALIGILTVKTSTLTVISGYIRLMSKKGDRLQDIGYGAYKSMF